jgi:hypothetical protein
MTSYPALGVRADTENGAGSGVMNSVTTVTDQRADSAVPLPYAACRETIVLGSPAPDGRNAFRNGVLRLLREPFCGCHQGTPVRARRLCAGGPRLHLRGRRLHPRLGVVAELRGHAGGAAAADRVLAGRPAARRDPPVPGRAAAATGGRGAAAAAAAARPSGLGTGGADRSGRLAGVRLPADQAAGPGARRRPGGVLLDLRAAVPDLPAVVGDLAPRQPRRSGSPGSVAVRVVGPGGRRPGHQDVPGHPGAGTSGRLRGAHGPVEDRSRPWTGR